MSDSNKFALELVAVHFMPVILIPLLMWWVSTWRPVRDLADDDHWHDKSQPELDDKEIIP